MLPTRIRNILNDLCSLQQPQLALVLDQCSSLDVGPGLVGDLHDELLVLLDDHVEDVEVHRGPEVVNVGDEAVLLTRLDVLLQQPAVEEGLIEVSMAWSKK